MKYSKLVYSIVILLLSCLLLTSCFVRIEEHEAVVKENAQLKSQLSSLKSDYDLAISENRELQKIADTYRLNPQLISIELETAYVNSELDRAKEAFKLLEKLHAGSEYYSFAKSIYEKLLSPEAISKAQREKDALSFTERNLGTWRDSAMNAEVILKQTAKNRFDLIYSFNDGSKFVEPHYIKQVKELKALLLPVEDNYGEFLILDLKTNVIGLYDQNGYDRSLRPVRVGSLLFLNDIAD